MNLTQYFPSQLVCVFIKILHDLDSIVFTVHYTIPFDAFRMSQNIVVII